MILDILAFRNKSLKCYTSPFFTQEKLDNMETNMTRSISLGGQAAKEKYKNLVLYHFGTFDDNSGKYCLKDEPEFLFDCDDIIAGLSSEV